MLTRALVLLVVACGDNSPSDTDPTTPDSSIADADAMPPPPDAKAARYPVLYTRYNQGSEIVAASFDGEILPVRRLNGGLGGAGQTALSPDETRMAFTSFDYAASTWDVIVRPIAGTEADEVVIAKTVGGAAMPAWSHDGKRIAYVSFTGEAFTYGVYVVAATGGTPRVLTTFESTAKQAPCIAPRWSPDDAEIAFSTVWGVASFVLADDRVNHLVPMGKERTCTPQWSPDGSALAFSWGGNDAYAPRIARVSRTGGAVTILAPMEGGSNGQAQWSRDGRRVAFVDYDYDVSSAVLRVSDPAGGPPVALDNLTCGIIGGHPTWSPDGTELLYTRYDRPNSRVQMSRIRAEAGSSRVDLAPDNYALDSSYATWLATPLSGE